MPDFSIITPTYNRAPLLGRLWQSISSQSADFEWILVDDGSDDDTEAVVSSFGDPRIVYVQLPENRGVNSARNAGVSVSRGRYIIFIDSDDELYPDALSWVIEHMEKAGSNIGVVLFACVLASSGRVINEPTDGRILSEYDIVCEYRLGGGDMVCVYRREVFDYYELPENLLGCEQVFVYQISKKYNFLLINKPLSIVYRQNDNLSSGDSIVKRSFDIAKSYEVLIDNHSNILKQNPTAMNCYLSKAMYRYGVAGSRGNVWRIYRRQLRARPSYRVRFIATALMVFSMLGSMSFERWRINMLNRRLFSSRI